MFKQVAQTNRETRPLGVQLILAAIMIFHGCAAAAQTKWLDHNIHHDVSVITPFLNIASLLVGVGNGMVECRSSRLAQRLPHYAQEQLNEKSGVDIGIAAINQLATYSGAILLWFPNYRTAYWAASMINVMTFWLNTNARYGTWNALQCKEITATEKVGIKNAWTATTGLLAIALVMTEKGNNIGATIMYAINGASAIASTLYTLCGSADQRQAFFDELSHGLSQMMTVATISGTTAALVHQKKGAQYTVNIVLQGLATWSTYHEHPNKNDHQKPPKYEEAGASI